MTSLCTSQGTLLFFLSIAGVGDCYSLEIFACACCRVEVLYDTAGALGGYMWKHREVNESTDKLLSIAGIAAISLAIGWSNETKVDNLGQYGRTPSFALAGSVGPRGQASRGGPRNVISRQLKSAAAVVLCLYTTAWQLQQSLQ